MHSIRGGFRDEQAAPERAGAPAKKTSCPNWRPMASCSSPGKHNPPFSVTCHCCCSADFHSVAPDFTAARLMAEPRNLQVNPSLLKAWVDVDTKSVCVFPGLFTPVLNLQRNCCNCCLVSLDTVQLSCPFFVGRISLCDDRLMCQLLSWFLHDHNHLLLRCNPRRYFLPKEPSHMNVLCRLCTAGRPPQAPPRHCNKPIPSRINN